MPIAGAQRGKGPWGRSSPSTWMGAAWTKPTGLASSVSGARRTKAASRRAARQGAQLQEGRETKRRRQTGAGAARCAASKRRRPSPTLRGASNPQKRSACRGHGTPGNAPKRLPRAGRKDALGKEPGKAESCLHHAPTGERPEGNQGKETRRPGQPRFCAHRIAAWQPFAPCPPPCAANREQPSPGHRGRLNVAAQGKRALQPGRTSRARRRGGRRNAGRDGPMARPARRRAARRRCPRLPQPARANDGRIAVHRGDDAAAVACGGAPATADQPACMGGSAR